MQNQQVESRGFSERSDHGNDIKTTGGNSRCGRTQELLGIITDGDLRRMLEKNADASGVRAQDIMSSNPTTIQNRCTGSGSAGSFANKRYQPVAGDGRKSVHAGFIHLHDLIKEGII